MRMRSTMRRIPRVAGISFNRVIPNMITLLALCFGVNAIRFAMDERWQFAVAAVVIAALLDTLDGRVARLLKSASEFGAQLDSLSDVIAFGVAPTFILYLYVLHLYAPFGWAAALLLTLCCCLRLARFNSLIGKLPPYAFNYFQGVPAPMAALLALWPMIMEFAYGWPVRAHAPIISVWVFVVALLAVSAIPTFSFKQIKISYRWGVLIGACLAVMVAALFSDPWQFMSLFCLFYIILIPISIYCYRRLRSEALHLLSQPRDEGTDAETR